MLLYLDDDSANALLVKLLRNAGHDVQTPAEAEMSGRADPLHLAHAIDEGRAILTHNHDDFRNLHTLVAAARGHHAGVLVVRRDNDPRRDMSPRGIVHALEKALAAGQAGPDSLVVLNHWR